MAAIENLCQKTVVLDNGKLAFHGEVKKGLDFYLKTNQHSGDSIISGVKKLHGDVEIEHISINGSEQNNIRINPTESALEIKIEGSLKASKKMALEVRFYDKWQSLQAMYSPGHKDGRLYDFQEGKFEILESIHLPKNMTSGELFLDIGLSHPNVEWFMYLPKHVKLDVIGVAGITGLEFRQENCGLLMLDSDH